MPTAPFSPPSGVTALAEPPAEARPWWRPHAIALAAMAAVLSVLTWQVIVYGPLTALDWPVHEAADANQPTGWSMALSVLVARLGQRAVTIPLMLLAAGWCAWKLRSARPVVAVVVSLGSLYVLGYGLKYAVGRTPPRTEMDAVFMPGFVSYPSGHAANAALTYAFIAVLLWGASGWRPDRRLLRIGLAVSAVPTAAVGVLMVSLDYHWLSEIPTGWLLGYVVLGIGRLALGPPRPAAPGGSGPPGTDGDERAAAG
ncbi:phosphatase PAP2 family protein [Allonocardiopsis opalescens]|uniref:PAP2 superfamily protein n=1 Tax=Allonocardiopsis opalescens TaxID=1144618 RepID=A0A2T0Q9D3_9ACTN|nr:phosphatase PAP2 family protein [Allonocardiopsis opalescens]PRY00411.1 PAP2 superfamily protein [Allonocardiopsis opalescens]